MNIINSFPEDPNVQLALRITDYVMWREWKNALFWKAIFSFFPAFLLSHQIGTVPFKESLEGSSQLQRTGGEKGTGVLTALATLMGQGGSNISLQQGLQAFNEDDHG